MFTYSSLSSSDSDDGDAPQNALIPEKENIFVLHDITKIIEFDSGWAYQLLLMTLLI